MIKKKLLAQLFLYDIFVRLHELPVHQVFQCYMILRLTEGSLSPVECLDDNGAICDREENCVTQILWKKLDDAIKGVVDHITLEDLMNWQFVKADEYII